MLPPSPRLLVAHGRYDDALYALARLRKRTRQAAESDPLLRVSEPNVLTVYDLAYVLLS